MSYRTYVNDVQIFGNNESYPEWYDFIKNEGIKIDSEGKYCGEITDFMKMMTCIESIVLTDFTKNAPLQYLCKWWDEFVYFMYIIKITFHKKVILIIELLQEAAHE